jgi:hypothetical protein
MKGRTISAGIIFSLLLTFAGVMVTAPHKAHADSLYCDMLWDQERLTMGQYATGQISGAELDEDLTFIADQLDAAGCFG